MDLQALRDPSKRVAFAFGQEMKPCPKCSSFEIRYQTPIQVDLNAEDTPRTILAKWAKAVKNGHTPLQGPVFIMCFNCGHMGPSVDCSGRTSEDVGKDPAVAAEVRRLWNNQEPICQDKSASPANAG